MSLVHANLQSGPGINRELLFTSAHGHAGLETTFFSLPHQVKLLKGAEFLLYPNLWLIQWPL